MSFKLRFLDNRDKEELESSISELAERISDLEYFEIKINAFSVSPSTAEIGSTVTSLTVSFSLNKSANDIILEGKSIGSDWGDSGTVIFTDVAVEENKTYTLRVTDERGHAEQKAAMLSFLNGAYYGTGNPASVYNAFIRGLVKVLTSSRARTITVNAEAGQYIWYAIPARFGTPTFTVGGFTGGFTLAKTMDFTNASGYTESYNIYKSDNASLGNTTIVIS